MNAITNEEILKGHIDIMLEKFEDLNFESKDEMVEFHKSIYDRLILLKMAIEIIYG